MKRLTICWIILAAFLVMSTSCDRVRKHATTQLLELSREQLKRIDDAETRVLRERIDSLGTIDMPVDTVVADVCTEVAKQLRLAHCYKELWRYVSDTSDDLDRITSHERAMQDRLMNMNLEVAAGYYDLQLFDRYLQLLIKLKPIAERYGFENHLAEIHIDMAAVYIERHQFDRSLSVLEPVVQNKERISDNELVQTAYLNIATAWAGKKDYQKAVEYAILSLHHVTAETQEFAARTRIELAAFYFLMNEYSLAYKQLEEIRDYCEDHDNHDLLVELLTRMGVTQWKIGRTEEAAQTFERTMVYCDSCNNQVKLMALKDYSIFCDSLGMKDRQIALQKELIALYKNTILGNSNDMLTQLYSEQLNESDKNLQDYRRSRWQLWVTAVLLLATLAGMAWWMHRRYARQRDEKRAVEKECDSLSEQLVQASIDHERLDSLIQSLTKSLQSLQRNVVDAPRKDILKEVRSMTAQVIRADDNKRDTDLLMLANADFFNHLMERFPDLTTNDLRVCALLRRGISSKEIAEILCRDPHTIDTVRMRIRRKCGLAPEDDLCQFMMQI